MEDLRIDLFLENRDEMPKIFNSYNYINIYLFLTRLSNILFILDSFFYANQGEKGNVNTLYK